MSYLNARYYDGSKGRFISEDMMFWKLPIELLIDPQQQNSYSYARNNPINGSDPSGMLTAIIPGTGYNKKDWSRSGKAKDFISSVEKTFGEKAHILFWGGENNKRARTDAATVLTKEINDHFFFMGEKLNIIGHSHGGNIGILTSQMTNRKIDNLVTLGTPARVDYQPNYNMIGNHINVYSNIDLAQTGGGKVFGGIEIRGTIPWTNTNFSFPVYFGPTPANRTFGGAENIGVTQESFSTNPVRLHSNFWMNSDVWSKINAKL